MAQIEALIINPDYPDLQQYGHFELITPVIPGKLSYSYFSTHSTPVSFQLREAAESNTA